jgi:hypothetical protein
MSPQLSECRGSHQPAYYSQIKLSVMPGDRTCRTETCAGSRLRPQPKPGSTFVGVPGSSARRVRLTLLLSCRSSPRSRTCSDGAPEGRILFSLPG